MLPKRELEKRTEDKTMGELAQLMSRGMRKITPQMKGCMVIFINQVRENIGVMWGSSRTTPGGKALGFYSSLNLEMNKAGLMKEPRPIFNVDKQKFEDGDTVVGHNIHIRSKKDKTGSRPEQACKLGFRYELEPPGVLEADELWQVAMMHGFIVKEGRTFKSSELDIHEVGVGAFTDRIKNDSELQQKIREMITDKISIKTNE